MGLNGEGRALIKSGAVADGLALLDEAMVTVQEGRLDPFMTGVLYCHTIAACHEVGDVLRMTPWTELAERWLTTVPAEVTFGAMCAVHRAEVSCCAGRGTRLSWERCMWLRASTSIGSTMPHRPGTSPPRFAVARWAGAAEAYGEAHARGYDPQPGRALLRLADGDAEGALASVLSAVAAAGPDPLRRAPLCAALVEIAIAAGHPQDAAAAASELAQTASTFATSGLEAMAATRGGAVLLAEGNVAEALPVLRDACRRWYELGSAYDAAGPAPDSPRPTGRSATRPPPTRSWRGRRQFMSGWCAGRCASCPMADPA